MPPATPPADGPVVAATRAELEQLPDDLQNSAIAAGALVMAQILDSPDGSYTSKSMCFEKLHKAMDRLRELAPPKEKPKDGIDELKAARARRRAGSAAT
ncbi:MAG TPA: hypothetical protein VN803_10365 [Gemmatimonadales bacterium]|nr:hypothetical protein [Gemmatimonadales bacterium]